MRLDEHKVVERLRNRPTLLLCDSIRKECLDKLNCLQTSDNCEIAQ